MLASVKSEQSRTGVCVVRVESQPNYALIMVQCVPDVEHPRYEKWHTAPDIESALALVRTFLNEALSAGGP